MSPKTSISMLLAGVLIFAGIVAFAYNILATALGPSKPASEEAPAAA